MRSLVADVQPSESQIEESEFRKAHPEKFGDDVSVDDHKEDFDYEMSFMKNSSAADKPKEGSLATYSRSDVARLMAASQKGSEVQGHEFKPVSYSTYSREQMKDMFLEYWARLEKTSFSKKELEEWEALSPEERALRPLRAKP